MSASLEVVGGIDTLCSLGAEELAGRLGGALDALCVAEEYATERVRELRMAEKRIRELEAALHPFGQYASHIVTPLRHRDMPMCEHKCGVVTIADFCLAAELLGIKMPEPHS